MLENSTQKTARIREALKEKMLPRLPEPGDFPTAVEGLVLHRRDVVNTPDNCFYKPIFALTVQGAKRTVMGNEEYRYGEGHCLVAGVDMPSMNYITDASPEKPYMVAVIHLDSQIISQLAAEIPPASKVRKSPYKGTAVAPVDPEVLNAVFRLVELLDKPEQIPVLAPMSIREIHYRLLLGPQGELLRQLNTKGTQSNQILRAITWMRENVKAELDVNALAQNVNMAPPTFRRHFKGITTMSPLQYHKFLRLYEAQRLMLVENADALHAGYEVGYESPTQFNREYKRLFGEPPHRSVSHLR